MIPFGMKNRDISLVTKGCRIRRGGGKEWTGK